MASTLDITFEDFKEWLMNKFADEYTLKDSTYKYKNAYQKFEKEQKEAGKKDENGEEPYMLAHYGYTAAQEAFLIYWAKFYIKNRLDSKQSHNVSPVFLGKLTNKMAKYLSRYVAQKYPDGKKSQNRLRLDAQEELKKALFDENAHIVSLLAQQQQKRDMRQEPWQKRKKYIAAQKRAERKAAYNKTRKVEGQVKSVFNDAQNTPRKPR